MVSPRDGEGGDTTLGEPLMTWVSADEEEGSGLGAAWGGRVTLWGEGWRHHRALGRGLRLLRPL